VVARAAVTYSTSTWQQKLPTDPSPERTHLVEHVALLVAARSSGRLRVAIDGYTASGKTSFGHELAHALARSGRPAYRATLDDFKRPWRDRHLYDRESGEGYYRNAYDLDGIHRLLLDPASASGSGAVALCSIDPITQLDHSESVVHVPSDGVLIVDGVFAFRPELDDAWDVRIWLDVGADLALRRGVDRDAAMYGDAAAAEALHRDRYQAAEAIYVREADPVVRADIVIDNRDFDLPRLLKPDA
jgi:uridine kinase